MYTQISDEMKKMLEADARTFLMKLQSDTFEITSGFRKIVYQGGSSGEGLAIGTTVSASVEITMEKTEHLLTGKEFSFYLGMNVEEKEEYIPLGIFKAQKPTATDWDITVKAYDRMYDAEKTYTSSLHYPTDTQKVMQEIEKLLGIRFVTKITPIQLKKTGESDVPFAGYTIRETIGFVAGLYGKFAIFNRAGELEFRWYESGMKIQVNRMFSFERNEQDYKVQKVAGSSDSNTNYTAGSGNRGISYSNPFLTQEIVNRIYNSHNGFSYRGGTVTFLGDCRIDPWDMLQVNDLQGNTYQIPAMQITHEIDGGLTTTITAQAEEEDVEDSFTGPTTKAMDRTFAELLLVNKLVATKASIEYLESNYIKTSELDAVKANIETAVITNLKGKFATIEYIKANYATIGNLSAANAKIDTLEATALTASSAEIVALKTGIADINTLMFGSASGGSLSTEFSNSVVSMIGDAQIKSAMIKDISADKITSGKIYTNQVEVVSRTGNLDIADNTIQIKDGKKVVRVQIGKDASGDYNIYIWDKNGKLMFDPLYGVQEDGIKQAIIRNDMISDTANISGKKIDIASLITTINEDGSSTLNASKIYVDTDKQTLDISFKTITEKTDTAVSTANSASASAATALGKAQDVVDRADRGEFKGDKGDTGAAGATGATGLKALQPTRHWTGTYTTIGQTTGYTVSDFNRIPVVGDTFTNLDGASNTGTWKVISANASDGIIQLLSYVSSKGATGPQGDTGATGKGLKAVTPQYYLSTSNTTQNGGSWSSSKPTWVTGRYYWTRDKMDWSDNTTTYSTPLLATDLNNLYSSMKTVTDTVKTQGMDISALKNNITTKIWQQDITTAVTSLEIGGRNLLQGTKDFSKGTRPVSGIFDLSNTVGTYKVLKAMCPSGRTLYDPFQQSITIEAKTTYTLSFYAKADSPCTIFSYFYDIGNAGSYYDGYKSTTLTTYWKHYIITWTTGDTARTASVLPMRLQATKNVWAYMYGIKFEKGNKATDWTPAPEDVDADIASVEKTVTTLSDSYSNLSQSLTEISGEVSKNKTEIEKKADGTTVTNLSNDFSKFKQDSSQFQTTVSQTYATKTEFNNLEIGGTNLMTHSAKLAAYIATGVGGYAGKAVNYTSTNYPSGNYTAITCIKAGTGFYITGMLYNTNGKIKQGDKLTLSGYLYCNKDKGLFSPAIEFGTNSLWIARPKLHQTWEYFAVTFTANKTVTTNTSAIAICFYMGFSAGDEVQISSFKLEKGTKPTSWSPAPEDVESSIATVSTTATQTANKFQWIVKSGTSATNFTLTDRVATLLSDKFDITALTTFKTKAQNGTETVINGGAIKTGTITADKVLIGEQANLITINPNSEASLKVPTGFSNYSITADDKGQRCIIGKQTDTYLMFCNYMPNVFAGGDEIYFKGTVPNFGSKTITGTLHIWLYDGNYKFLYDYGGTTMTFVSGTWNDVSGSVTIPSGYQTKVATYYIVGIHKSSADVAIGLKNGAVCQKKKTGQLIVNGTITADKIKVDSLQAICAKIGGFTIDNNNIASGTWGTSGSVMMCTGTDGAKSIGGSGTISGWCFTAGAKFGVTKTGSLYASDITVNGGKIDLNASSVTTAASSTTAYFRTAYSSSCYARISSGKDCSEIKIVDGNSKIFLSAESGGAFIQSYKGDELKLHYYDGYLRADEIQAKTKLTCQSFSASGSATITGNITTSGKLTATGNFELRTSGNASNLILHDDYAKYCYIRYSGARLWFLPATDSGGFELANSASLDANSGTFYATAWGSNSSRKYKENITELQESVADRLLKIKTYHFDYKKDYGNKDMYGVIAEEVEQVHKNAVLYRNGEPDAVDYTRFIPLLIKKVQMQDKKLKYLENVVAHLIGIAMNPEQVEVEKVRK